MFKKLCSRCMCMSYSSSNLANWLCPHCANDLTEEKAKKVDHTINISLMNKRLDQQMGINTYRQLSISKRN